MILHLLWDEKITHRIIKTFDTVFPDQNHYLFWEYDFPTDLHFAYEGESSQIVKNDFSPAFDVSKVSKVIIHGLDKKKINFCKRYIPASIPVFWVLWGKELYNDLISKKGYEIYYEKPGKKSYKSVIGSFLRKMGVVFPYEKVILDFFTTNDVTMVCAQQEYELIKHYYPRQTKLLKNKPGFFYYPIDEMLGPRLVNAEAKGDYIMVGNSASMTNNHSLVFDILKNINLRGKTIVTPLSYSGNPIYKEKIITKGKAIYGTSYLPLTDFLSLEEYNSLFVKSEVCIYGNWRQEAMGNIVVALYLGAKVFISERNPLYKILKQQGLEVFSLEKLTQIDLDNPLPNDIKIRNREIIRNVNSWTRLQQVTRDTFK